MQFKIGNQTSNYYNNMILYSDNNLNLRDGIFHKQEVTKEFHSTK